MVGMLSNAAGRLLNETIWDREKLNIISLEVIVGVCVHHGITGPWSTSVDIKDLMTGNDS